MAFATNPDGHRNFSILETLEAGLALTGPEVKSIKRGDCSLKGAHAVVHGNSLMLVNMHVGLYKPAAKVHQDPERSRRLLVHKKDIARFTGKVRTEGMALIPLSVYGKGGLIKVELGLGRGKKKYDKRADIKKRDVNRDMARAMRVKG